MRFQLPSVAIAALFVVRVASAQYFEARNMAMGGAGVASSHYLAAGWANPALLTRSREGENLGFILPTIGAVAYDKTNLISDIDDFVNAYDALNANASATPQDYVNLAAQLQALSGRPVNANVGLGFVVAVPAHDLAWALHVHSYADLQAVAAIDPADLVAIATNTPGTPLPNLNSEARIIGAAITELGVSLATRFDLAGLGLSIGATPKWQRVDTYNYSVNVNTFDSNNFDDSQYRNDDGAFNLDLGASFEPGLGLSFGLMARDLVANDYDTVTTFGERFTYRVQPNIALGAAWQLGMLTVTADADLIARERFRDHTLALTSQRLEDDVQTLHLGAELDLAHWIQLRGGVQFDVQDTLDNAYSAGVGLSPFDVFHFDVAGVYVDQHSYGATVQLGFTF